MKTFEIKLKDSLTNPNSSYYKRFNGILTKIVTCKNEKEIKDLYTNKIVSITEL
jgi:hypothetical protein